MMKRNKKMRKKKDAKEIKDRKKTRKKKRRIKQGKILQYPNVGAPELPSNFSPIWLCPPYVFVDKHFKH